MQYQYAICFEVTVAATVTSVEHTPSVSHRGILSKNQRLSHSRGNTSGCVRHRMGLLRSAGGAREGRGNLDFLPPVCRGETSRCTLSACRDLNDTLHSSHMILSSSARPPPPPPPGETAAAGCIPVPSARSLGAFLPPKCAAAVDQCDSRPCLDLKGRAHLTHQNASIPSITSIRYSSSAAGVWESAAMAPCAPAASLSLLDPIPSSGLTLSPALNISLALPSATRPGPSFRSSRWANDEARCTRRHCVFLNQRLHFLQSAFCASRSPSTEPQARPFSWRESIEWRSVGGQASSLVNKKLCTACCKLRCSHMMHVCKLKFTRWAQ